MTSPKLTVGQKAAKSVHIVERKLRSSPVFVTLIVFTFILYLAVLVLNCLAVAPHHSSGLFQHGTVNVARVLSFNFMPAWWTFYIGAVIYLLQLLWVTYSLVLTCLEVSQEPAYLNPVILSPAFYIFFNLSSVFNIGWLFLWDKLLHLASFMFLACIALSLILTTAIVASRMVMFKDTLIDQNRFKELKFLQITVVNSVAMYATWAVVCALLNLGMILVYKWDRQLSEEVTAILCVSVLAFMSLVYVILDSTLIARYTRYCLTPYVVVIWTLAGSVAENYNPGNLSSIMSTFFVGAISLAFCVKLGLTCFRSTSRNGQYTLMKTALEDDCAN
ncbi:unnamed protein product [Candidula unifasciata]|uniref:Uncharacterized protein n=1 Tax=Candidula unifasciata TaxID=100452 RepID=A0A8S3Z049_9EUPU|nr:unnamed protein product [Candidula unifasciata]